MLQAPSPQGKGLGGGFRAAEMEQMVSIQGAKVLCLAWLADPARSRCPPVRHAMLQVLEVGRFIPVSGESSVVLAALPVQAESLRKACLHDLQLGSGTRKVVVRFFFRGGCSLCIPRAGLKYHAPEPAM